MPRDEDAVHMALVGETRTYRGIDQCRAMPDQVARRIETTLHHIGVRCQSGQARKTAHGLVAAEPGERGKLRQAMGASRRGVDPFARL